MAVLLFVPSIALIIVGIVYITRKGLDVVNADVEVDEQVIEDYVKTRNPSTNCIFWGVMMLIAALYLIVVAIGILVSSNLTVVISSIIMAIIALIATMYYYNAKALFNNKGDNNGRNQNVKDKTE